MLAGYDHTTPVSKFHLEGTEEPCTTFKSL